MEIRVTELAPEKRGRKPVDESKLGFGRYFSDHMFLMNYQTKKGWHSPRIEPRRPLELDPAALVLHYGQEVFEGLKAYRSQGGGIYLFRYRDNIRRFNRSCRRLVIPELDEEIFAQGLKKLVLLEKDWIPTSAGCSLYIRPNVIATDAVLGVRPSETYLFYIICGPVGPYYPEGFNPISIYVADKYVRAAPGGIGEAKTCGNYAASLLAQKEAKEQGFSQVLWLDAKERRYVEEVGTMNIFFRIGEEVITSPLTGTILPGVTRDSVITVLKSWGVKVAEQPLAIDEIIAAQKKGTLREVFGSGTAAVISPVGSIRYRGEDFRVGDGGTGELSRRLFDYLQDLQYGRQKDPFGWVERID
jgi:branched-chain amino acid aminotransferase